MDIFTLEGAGLTAWSNSKKNSCLMASVSVYDSFNQSITNDEDSSLQIHSFDLMNKTNNN